MKMCTHTHLKAGCPCTMPSTAGTTVCENQNSNMDVLYTFTTPRFIGNIPKNELNSCF